MHDSILFSELNAGIIKETRPGIILVISFY